MAKYLLYPGCSMESSAKAYSDSLMAVSKPIGLELEEVEDWNCCGATEYWDRRRRVRAHLAQPGTGFQAGQRQPDRGRALQRMLFEPGQGRLLHAGTAQARRHGQ
jgi:hypothetical protein